MMYWDIDWRSKWNLSFHLRSTTEVTSELRFNRLLSPSLSVVGSQPGRRKSGRLRTWDSNLTATDKWRIQGKGNRDWNISQVKDSIYTYKKEDEARRRGTT
jgi:hypothetical protein